MLTCWLPFSPSHSSSLPHISFFLSAHSDLRFPKHSSHIFSAFQFALRNALRPPMGSSAHFRARPDSCTSLDHDCLLCAGRGQRILLAHSTHRFGNVIADTQASHSFSRVCSSRCNCSQERETTGSAPVCLNPKERRSS